MSKIALLVTSTRASRLAPSVGAWIKPILKSAFGPSSTVTTVDVADFKLPVFDDGAIPAMVPSMAQFTQPHSKAWSDEIEKYSAYVLLANEYNFGMSGSTKNAIDYLYNAWIGKPILIISYGIVGGTNASDQLKTVLTGMKLRVAETRPQLGFFGAQAGPDMYTAMQGKLGEATINLWNEEKKSDILKGVEEVKALLAAPPVEEKPKE